MKFYVILYFNFSLDKLNLKMLKSYFVSFGAVSITISLAVTDTADSKGNCGNNNIFAIHEHWQACEAQWLRNKVHGSEAYLFRHSSG